MLEKNKDYLEMSVSSTDCAFTQNAATQIGVDGYVYTPYMDLPTPGEFYILISKEKFEKLQTENEELKKKLGEFDFMGWMESAKLWKKRYDDIFKLIGFSSDEELHDYLTNEAECDTLREAIASLEHNVKFARDEHRDLSKKLDECEKDYISERDKVTALQIENEQLKKKLQVPDPFAEYKELFEKLHSKEDIEKFEWTLNHICGGQASANGWMVTAKLWRRNYETLSKLVGFSSTEEIQDYLTNEAECDTLQEAISELYDQVKYAWDEWCSANSSNNSWKAAAECNSPKELIEKREALEKEIGVYSRALKEWKEGTGCPSPSAAKTLIESDMSRYHAYNEIKKANEKLADSIHQWQKVTGYDNPKDFLKWKANIEGIVEAWKSETGCKYPGDARRLLEKWQTMTRSETPENAAKWLERFEETDKRCDKLAREVESWKNVTGYSTPEDYMHARISGAFHTPFDYTSAWQKATGFSTPEKCSSYIDRLEKKLEDIKNLTEED